MSWTDLSNLITITIFEAGPAESSGVYLEEGWIADCFNDEEMNFNAEDMYVFLVSLLQFPRDDFTNFIIPVAKR